MTIGDMDVSTVMSMLEFIKLLIFRMILYVFPNDLVWVIPLILVMLVELPHVLLLLFCPLLSLD